MTQVSEDGGDQMPPRSSAFAGSPEIPIEEISKRPNVLRDEAADQIVVPPLHLSERSKGGSPRHGDNHRVPPLTLNGPPALPAPLPSHLRTASLNHGEIVSESGDYRDSGTPTDATSDRDSGTPTDDHGRNHGSNHGVRATNNTVLEDIKVLQQKQGELRSSQLQQKIDEDNKTVSGILCNSFSGKDHLLTIFL